MKLEFGNARVQKLGHRQDSILDRFQLVLAHERVPK